jgi:hypothetical protein
MASIVTQAILNAMTKALEDGSVDPTSDLGKEYLRIIGDIQSGVDTVETAKQKKADAEKDAKTKKAIAKKKAQIAVAEAKKQDTTELESQLNVLRAKIIDPTDPERFTKELRYGPQGESLVPGTPGFTSSKIIKDSTTSTSVVTPTVTPSPTSKPVTGGTVKTPTPTVDPKTAWIGYLQATFKTLPLEFKNEIDKIFEQALMPNSGWTQDTFNEAIKQTKWYQQTYPSVRQFFIESNDPRNAANFAEKLQLQTDNVAAKLEQLGIKTQQLDPVTGKYYNNSQTIQGIAMASIQNGWTDVQLLQHVGDNAQLLFTGGGTIGSSVEKIKQQALLYGINIDNKYLNKIQTSLLDPSDGRDAQWYLNEMQNQAIDLYKPFAESIKSGRSLYEITNNYRTKMSNLLEIDAENITWQDLMGKVIDPVTGNARMESEFTKQLKQDPLWQYTKNAKETYSNMSLDLMKQFGFIG